MESLFADDRVEIDLLDNCGRTVLSHAAACGLRNTVSILLGKTQGDINNRESVRLSGCSSTIRELMLTSWMKAA